MELALVRRTIVGMCCRRQWTAVPTHVHARLCDSLTHSLCSYNADFDGDEINVHFPQVCPAGRRRCGVLGVLGEWFVHE